MKHTTFRERSENTDLAVSSIHLHVCKQNKALSFIQPHSMKSFALGPSAAEFCSMSVGKLHSTRDTTTEAEGLQIPGARI